jgi:LL-diaminopimelate aminotransferase
MIHINDNYLKLKASYLFSDIGKRVAAHQQRRPDQAHHQVGHRRRYPRTARWPASPAFHKAVDEMAADAKLSAAMARSRATNFYGEAIAEHDFRSPAGPTSMPTKYSSVTAPNAIRAISRKFLTSDTRIAIPDPVYPAYLDTNVMAGRTGRIIGMGATMGLSTWTAMRKTDSSPSCPRRQRT